MIDFLIIGADGQQGTIATRKLLQEGYTVACSDVYLSPPLLEIIDGKNVEFVFCDLRQKNEFHSLVKRLAPRVIINAADDFYNDTVFDVCLATNTHHIDFGSDIAGTERRLRRFHEFKNAGLTAIMSCGSVPGIGSVMTRYLVDKLGGRVDEIETGFSWDSNMQDFVPPFFLFIVLLELSQPAHIIREGNIVEIPALSLVSIRDLPLVGEQKLYAVSHSELFSFRHYFHPRSMVFWAGFPEHSRRTIETLNAVGLNRNTPLRVAADSGSVDIHPCDFLTALGKTIKIPDGYVEWEYLWTQVSYGGEVLKMDCRVPVLAGWEKYGCNVDTAFPGCTIAKMILHGIITERGVFCPEAIVPCEPFFAEMQEYGFSFESSGGSYFSK